MIRAVTLDVDGTLYDRRPMAFRMLWRNWRRWGALRVGIRVREELRAHAFADGQELRIEEARIVAERLEMDAPSARALLDDIFDRSLCDALVSQRDARLSAALRAISSRGIFLGAISDRRIDDKLLALDLDLSQFQSRISADDTGILKPNALVLERIANAWGISMYQLVHIGDRDDVDGELARSAGARFIHVRSLEDTLRALHGLASATGTI